MRVEVVLALHMVVLATRVVSILTGRAGADLMEPSLFQTLYIGAFAFIIGNFQTLAVIMLESFAGLGLKASGGAMAIGDFMRPGVVAATGIDAAQPLLDASADLVGPVGLFTNFVQIMILLIAWVIVVLAFFILAVQVFITILEFKLVTLAGFVLLFAQGISEIIKKIAVMRGLIEDPFPETETHAAVAAMKTEETN